VGGRIWSDVGCWKIFMSFYLFLSFIFEMVCVSKRTWETSKFGIHEVLREKV
jgi:hypothetical protein